MLKQNCLFGSVLTEWQGFQESHCRRSPFSRASGFLGSSSGNPVGVGRRGSGIIFRGPPLPPHLFRGSVNYGHIPGNEGTNSAAFR